MSVARWRIVVLGVALVGAAAGCTPDRATLPVVREVENAVTAEYQSTWAGHRFTSEAAPARVAVVTKERGKGSGAKADLGRPLMAADVPAGGVSVQAVRGYTVVRPVRPDLAVEQVADRTHVLPGDSVTFTITLTNAGPVDIERIEVSDALPEGWEMRGVKGGESRPGEPRVARVYFPGPLPIGHAEKVVVTARVR
jgi:uncharacterized repeat protein (TIGR01451 family)